MTSRVLTLSTLLMLLMVGGCVSNDVFWCIQDRRPWQRFGSSEAAAFNILLAADRIESPLLGPAGVPSCLVTAYQQVLRQADAVAIFRKLYEQGSLPTKIYALAGLSETVPGVAEQLTASLRSRGGEKLERMDGCVGSETTVADLLARLTELQDMWRPAV